MSFIDLLIDKFHKSVFWGRIFHTLNYCLQNELKDCESVLDIGCGPSSPLQYCEWIKYSVGVEPFKPYLEESKKKKIHTKYLNKKIEELDFSPKSFDAVIMIEVLEHLPKKTGYEILKKAEKLARKKLIISTPNGFIKQPPVDKNLYQEHKSGYVISELAKLEFKCRGLAGLKFLRKPKNENDSMGEDLMVSLRFKPKIFWFTVATFSQIFTYFIPQLAFELFGVRRINQ